MGVKTIIGSITVKYMNFIGTNCIFTCDQPNGWMHPAWSEFWMGDSAFCFWERKEKGVWSCVMTSLNLNR